MYLWFQRGATIDAESRHAHGGELKVLPHLLGQLTGWCHDQDLGRTPAGFGNAASRNDALHDGNDKRQRLAHASACTTNHVLALDTGVKRLALHKGAVERVVAW